MYSLLRLILFCFDPEKIHHWVVRLLTVSMKMPGVRRLVSAVYKVNDDTLQRTLMGITFPNPVGLAAGFDKDAKVVDELAALGFGFIEIGTVTPKPQLGNDKPRLFRLPADKALINRMGFNNDGVAEAARRLKERHSTIVVGGNIGKNKMTPNAKALDDYLQCIDVLYPYVDYFIINVSSPNTPGLRELQEKEPLRLLLQAVKEHTRQKPVQRPVMLKIAPDLTDTQLNDIVEIVKATGTDGVVATNTTINREGLNTAPAELVRIGAGGLSGGPLRARATEVIRYLRERLGPGFAIVAVGGIFTGEDAMEKINAGADLIQIYTGFIYEGPGIVRRINRRLLKVKR